MINKKTYSYEVDYWSIGVILFILLTGRFPFNGVTQKEIFDEICNQFPSFTKKEDLIISEGAKDLTEKLLIKTPRDRLKAKDALQHPWIKTEVLKDTSESKIGDDVVQNLKRYSTSSK